MTKSKHTKRALIVSALCLLLCVSMLVGTTFAWFTDKASTNVNNIQAGTLDIELQQKKADGTWEDAEGKTLDFTKAGTNILWEPGCSWTLPAVRLINNGNLWLKYKVTINGITGGDAMLAEVIDVIVGGNTVGTLADLVKDADGAAYGTLAPNGTASEEIALTLHMQETAGNDYQNKKLEGISINVQATQWTEEHDSFNNTYDANAQYDPLGSWENYAAAGNTDIVVDDNAKTVEIYTAAGLAKFAKNINTKTTTYSGYTVTLENDIDLSGHYWTPIGQTQAGNFSGNFDGNGKTIRNMCVDGSAETSEHYASGLFGWVEDHGAATTISNLTIDGATVKGNQYVGAVVGYASGNLTIQNCQVTNSSITAVGAGDKAAAVVGFINGGNSVTNCSASNCAVTAGRDAGQIVGCTVGDPAKVSGCTATNVTVSATGLGSGANINNDIIGRKA